MNIEEVNDAECDPLSTLGVTVDNVVQVLLNREEEVQKLTEKKQSLDSQVEEVQETLFQIQQEKTELEAQLTRLKLRNAAYQREHTNLRNGITIVKYQIERIKEFVEKQRAREMEILTDFEKAVDDVTEKFRSGPDDYSRDKLLNKIEEGNQHKKDLLMEIEKLTDSYAEILTERGLKRGRKKEEDVIDYVVPGSEIFQLIEITKNLDLVMFEINEIMGENNAKNTK